MIGRGCYGRPWFPPQAAALPAAGTKLADPSLADQKATLLDHYRRMLGHTARDRGPPRAQACRLVLEGLPGSAEFRSAMNRSPAAEAVPA